MRFLYLLLALFVLAPSVSSAAGQRWIVDDGYCIKDGNNDIHCDVDTAAVDGKEAKFGKNGDLLAGRCMTVGGSNGTGSGSDVVTTSGSCICRDSATDRIFADKDCGGPTDKDVGEEFIDNVGLGIVYATSQTSDSANGTPTAINGLSFSIGANVNAAARCYFVSTSANAATGIRYAVTGPASPTNVTLTLETFNAVGPPATTLIETSSAANFSFVSAATASIVTARQINMLTLFVDNGTNAGTIAFTIDPEDANAVTAEIGSWCEYSYQ